MKLRAAATLLGRDVRRGREATGAEHERQGAAERAQEEERCIPGWRLVTAAATQRGSSRRLPVERRVLKLVLCVDWELQQQEEKASKARARRSSST